MQNIIIALVVFLSTTIVTNAQCGKKINWHAQHLDRLAADSTVHDSKTGTILFETNSKTVRMSIVEAPEQTLEGTIKETSCSWTDAFKNGTTVYKTDIVMRNGQSSEATFTIDAKDGKIVIWMTIEKVAGRIWKIAVDKYEEVE